MVQLPAHGTGLRRCRARYVRFGQRVTTVTLADDAYDVADTIRHDLSHKARESDDLKPFAARCNEQVRRIAALFALFDLRSEITPDDLHAAAFLVSHAMDTVASIATGSGSKTSKRQPLSLAEKVRARLELFGGSARSSQVLPYVGASATEVKTLPGITVTEERQAVGRPAVRPSCSPSPTSVPVTVRIRNRRSPQPANGQNRTGTKTKPPLFRWTPTAPPHPRPHPPPNPSAPYPYAGLPLRARAPNRPGAPTRSAHCSNQPKEAAPARGGRGFLRLRCSLLDQPSLLHCYAGIRLM